MRNQIIRESGLERFAVIVFSEFQKIREILHNTEKLQDYLDYLHIQEIKKKNERMYSLEEAKEILGI